MTILMSGVNMYAMALVMKVMLGWNINFSIWVGAATVALYVMLGGLRSAIINEVLQFVLIWAGAALIPILGLIEAGGWTNLKAQIAVNVGNTDYTHMWSTLGHFKDNPMGINWIGIVFGLGVVISFGYWTTDFLVVQRVLSANNLRAAKMAPVIGAAFKMAVPFIVILPGLLALACCTIRTRTSSSSGRRDQVAPRTAHSYNEVLPLMLIRYCGPGLLGLGITALVAGFMSGMAGNVSAFSTVWTYDIYGAYINKNAPGQALRLDGPLVDRRRHAGLDRHRVPGDERGQHHGLCAGAVQLLHRAAVRHGDPRHAVEARHQRGRLLGLLAGTASSIGMWDLHRLGQQPLHDAAALAPHRSIAAMRSRWPTTCYRALWCWIICVLVTVIVSLMTKPTPEARAQRPGLRRDRHPARWSAQPSGRSPSFWACVVAAVFVILNIIFW